MNVIESIDDIRSKPSLSDAMRDSSHKVGYIAAALIGVAAFVAVIALTGWVRTIVAQHAVGGDLYYSSMADCLAVASRTHDYCQLYPDQFLVGQVNWGAAAAAGLLISFLVLLRVDRSGVVRAVRRFAPSHRH